MVIGVVLRRSYSIYSVFVLIWNCRVLSGVSFEFKCRFCNFLVCILGSRLFFFEFRRFCLSVGDVMVFLE